MNGIALLQTGHRGRFIYKLYMRDWVAMYPTIVWTIKLHKEAAVEEPEIQSNAVHCVQKAPYVLAAAMLSPVIGPWGVMAGTAYAAYQVKRAKDTEQAKIELHKMRRR